MSQRFERVCQALVAVGLLARVVLWASTEVYIDTAYYWAWGQRLDWSYYDHPPMTAWLLRLLGVHGTTALMSVGTIAAFGWAAAAVAKDRRAFWPGAACAAVTPAVFLASVIVNPDSGLFLFGALALGLAASGPTWLAALVFGAALLSKYPAILLAPALLALSFQRERRVAPLLLATLIGLLASAPVLFWNWQHDWISFRFQAAHGTAASPATVHTFAELVGAQLGLIGPLLFPLGLWWLAKGPGAWPLRLAAGLPLLVFLGLGTHSRAESNWPAFAALGLGLGLAPLALERPRLALASAVASLVVCLAGAAFLSLPTPWAAQSDPIKRLHGARVLAQLNGQGAVAVITPHYALTALAEYYAGLPGGTVSPRYNQYDVWGLPPLPPGAEAVWVSEVGPPPEDVLRHFERSARLPDLEGRFFDVLLHQYEVHRLIGARGAEVRMGDGATHRHAE